MRSLDPEERALWARVTREVRALGAPQPPSLEPSAKPLPLEVVDKRPPARSRPAAALRPLPHGAATLDGSWDRRLRGGQIAPDIVLDLHGHRLAGAHDAIHSALSKGIAGGARVILLVTGRAPSPGELEPRRGVIRAAVADWLAASPHARSIAAVRPAAPRHGGAGALYIVLRRKAPRTAC